MPIGSLWLPVIVSAVAVFVASFLIHMVLGYHKADLKRLPAEDDLRVVLGKMDPPPGMYFTPHCMDHKQMNDPATKLKFEKGPVAIITMLRKGSPTMGKHLALWFGYCLLVSFVTAYVARHTLAPGGPGLEVMRITCTVAFAGYALAQIHDSIWKGQPWGNTARYLLDGGIYAVATGLAFRLLWPAA
jgi:hypothetical protein